MPHTTKTPPSGASAADSAHNHQPPTSDNKWQSYCQYVSQCRQRIEEKHRKIPGITVERMVAINAPFEWHPDKKFKTNHGYKRAAIMLHGLNESAFSLRDIGHHLVDQGFLVRGVLLPGHGTTPTDLLHSSYAGWLKTLVQVIADTHQLAQEIYIYGFSLGSTLALHAALSGEAIDGLILFSPAISSKSPFSYLARWHKYAAQKLRFKAWRQKRVEVDYAKYCSSSYACISETVKGMRCVRRLLKKNPLKVPIFAVSTVDDETISTKTFIKYFKKLPENTPKKLMLYSANEPKKELLDNPDIMYRNSAYPAEHILDFSHTAIHHAPDNAHYGSHPDYYDYLHYTHPPQDDSEQRYLGAITAKNLRHENLARLHYNPDFTQLLTQLDQFIKKI